MKISCKLFNNGENIPTKYTCDGDFINPPLIISDVPKESVSLALIVEDPDAPVGLWLHWMVWNIDPKVTEISAGETNIGVVGKNSSNNNAWDDICPPNGEHRYFFKLFALREKLDLDPKTTDRSTFYESLKNITIESADLMGKYSRV